MTYSFCFTTFRITFQKINARLQSYLLGFQKSPNHQNPLTTNKLCLICPRNCVAQAIVEVVHMHLPVVRGGGEEGVRPGARVGPGPPGGTGGC